MLNTNYYRNYSNMISRINNYSNYFNRNSGIFGTSRNSFKNSSIEDLISQRTNSYSQNLKKYSEYKEKSDKFYSEFNSKFSELKNSSQKLKSYSVNSVFVQNTNTDDKEKSQEEIINSVKDFAEDYNDAVKFLDQNASVSDEIKNLSNSYKTIKYTSNSLSQIGIDVDYKTGLLSVNEDKLTDAIKSNVKNVRKILGDSSAGLASRIYNKTNVAIADSKELYPAVQLDNNHINNTYFYNPSNSSIIQSNIAYSSGLLLNYLV